MVAMRRVLILAVAIGVGILLQGCGDSPTSPKPKPSSPSTTFDPNNTATTTTTTNCRGRSSPVTSEQVAKLLNTQYMSYTEADETSDIGVVMQMQHSGQKQVTFNCMAKGVGQGCVNGNADCRSRTSLYNHRMMINTQTNAVSPAFGLKTGIIFNTSMVRSKFAKCAWQYDGVSSNRLNGGCGGVALGSKCDDKRCAYYNLDPATYTQSDTTAAGGKPCTDQSARVANYDCENTPAPATKPQDDQCYWKGIAFYESNGKDEIRKMISQRIKNQGHSSELVQTQNEIVLDDNFVIEELQRDAALAISAVAFVDNPNDTEGTTIAQGEAQALATSLSNQYCLSDTPLPVVGVDLSVDVTKAGATGPFVSYNAAVIM